MEYVFVRLSKKKEKKVRNLGKFVLLAFIPMLISCMSLDYQTFYSSQAPEKYESLNDASVFYYPNSNINDIYKLLFSDYYIVGKSAFNGPFEDPGLSRKFAARLGADILIATAQFKETRTSFINLETPMSTTTNISGYGGAGSFYGTATTYGTKTTSIPVDVDRYDQTGLFLKNLNHVKPLWERTKNDYRSTGQSNLTGTWISEGYKLELIVSGDQTLAFVQEVQKGEEREKFWREDDLKFVFSPETGVGIYLMGNKTPQPAKISVNNFGYLEISLVLLDDQKFSFKKQ